MCCAVALEQVDQRDDAELARLLLKRRHRGPVERLGKLAHVSAGRTLRMKPLERELGVAGEVGACARRALEARETARDVRGFVSGGVLLNERDSHIANSSMIANSQGG